MNPYRTLNRALKCWFLCLLNCTVCLRHKHAPSGRAMQAMILTVIAKPYFSGISGTAGGLFAPCIPSPARDGRLPTVAVLPLLLLPTSASCSRKLLHSSASDSLLLLLSFIIGWSEFREGVLGVRRKGDIGIRRLPVMPPGLDRPACSRCSVVEISVEESFGAIVVLTVAPA